MKLTKYQKAILFAVRDRFQQPTYDEKEGLLIEALAGTGKSTTLKLIAEELTKLGIHPGSCRFVVFGKKNSLDLKEKFKTIGPGWDKSVQTLNSLGYGILRDATGKSHKFYNLRGQKYLDVARDLGYLTKRDRDGNMNPGRLSHSEKAPIRSDRHFTELLEKLRLHCYIPPLVDEDAVEIMDQRYKWEFKSYHHQEIADAAKHCLQVGIERVEDGIIDFLDQIYYCWQAQSEFAQTFEIYRHKLQFIAVDEAQDTDELQIQFLKLLHDSQNNFLCAVGDRYQAVYYFRGCLSDGLDVIAKEFNCESMLLPINYRCGINHLRLVRTIFPYIKIKSHDGAPPGEIRCVRDTRLLDIVSDRSLSYFGISRKNAPLLGTAIKFLTAGIPAKIKDKSLGDKVLRTVEQVAGGKRKYDAYNFLDKLEDWQSEQLKRYSSELKHQEINDLASCLRALFDAFPLNSFEDWENKIDEIFDESKTDEKPIDLYTIHSGKGGEGEVSFLIFPDEMPITYKSQTMEEREQEDNMIYVALTRCMASESEGSGIFYFIVKTDDNLDPIWPKWLPQKYRKIWGDEDEEDEIGKVQGKQIIDVSNWGVEEVEEEVDDKRIIDFSNWGVESEEPDQPVEKPDEPVIRAHLSESSYRDEEVKSEDSLESSNPSITVSLELSKPVSLEVHKNKTEWVREILLKGSNLSGELIAEQVGCSAMLVSKTRKKLKAEGLLEPASMVVTANGKTMNVADIGSVPQTTPRKSKLDKARELLEDLTGDELRELFEEFLGAMPLRNDALPLTSEENDEEDEDLPF